jgi:AcrR family transcriptional regulator
MCPRTVESNQRIRDERQEQIFDAALYVFAHQGFAAAKITDIAARAGVSYGLIDHYFGKKEEIYIAVVRRAFEGGLQLMQNGFDRPESPWDRLRFIYTHILAGVKEQPEYIMLVSQIGSNDAIPPDIRALFTDYEKRSFAIQTELIREGQIAGQVIAGDPVELALAISSAITGLANQGFGVPAHPEYSAHFPSIETLLRILAP